MYYESVYQKTLVRLIKEGDCWEELTCQKCPIHPIQTKRYRTKAHGCPREEMKQIAIEKYVQRWGKESLVEYLI